MLIIFIINNKNQRLKNMLPKLEKHCEDLSPSDYKIIPTNRKKHAIELAQKAVLEGLDYLIAVGGDGTLNEVINGVMISGVPKEKHPVLGLLPGGSANDFSRTAGISSSITALFDLVKSNSHQEIDLGKIQLSETNEVRYFINISGIGLGAEVVKNLENSSSLLGPGFNYFKHIINGFLNYTKKEVRCSAGSWQWQGKLLQMAIANGRYLGNGIGIAPDANISDGQLQIAIFGDLSIWDYLKNLPRLKKGLRINKEDIHYYNADELILKSSSKCGIEADGEYVGFAPATFKVLPAQIRFLMPIKA